MDQHDREAVVPWFSAEQQPALDDFWTVYQAHYDAISAETLRIAEGHPELGPLVRAMTPEQMAAENQRSRAMLEGAIAGAWGPYEANLRQQGVVYASMGLSFSAWFDITRVFLRYLVPKLVDAYGAEPQRLSAVLTTTQDFIDHAMALLGETYLAAKETRINEQRALAEQRARRGAELEAQNLRIEEASRLKSEFLANMSHELRTPLNAIIGFAELMHDGKIGPIAVKHREFLGYILTSGRHLLQLINDVLDLAKVEAGKLELRPEPSVLDRLVTEVAAVLQATASEARIQVEIEVDPALVDVVIDPGRFKQVLYNYLSNALKFMPDGGRAVVRVRPEGEDAFRLEVEDSGIGIAPEEIGRLFTEFHQVDGGMTKRHAGTGLGLALTRRLVEAQGGTVGVTSTPGKGSVFHAVLPRRSTRTAPFPARRTFPGARAGAPSVLVVEDDADDQSSIAAALVEAGYEVETVSTGVQALARCRERAFDAITLDILLPDISGLTVLVGLRAEGQNRETPVIVLSVVAEKGAVAGLVVEGILQKPIDGAALVAALGKAGVLPGRAGRVLVVDDDEGSLRLMEAALAQLGYQAVCRHDAESALAAVEEERPVAVVLDLLMPGVDGFQLLDRLRRRPGSRHTPVIVWTSKDLTGEEQARLRAAAQAVVTKGHGASSTLLAALEAHLPVHPHPERG